MVRRSYGSTGGKSSQFSVLSFQFRRREKRKGIVTQRRRVRREEEPKTEEPKTQAQTPCLGQPSSNNKRVSE